MFFELIAEEDAARPLAALLADCKRMALDLEAAGYHRYSDAICLAQVTVADRHFILDPFALDVGELLRRPLEDPEVEVLMHGAAQDLRLLSRDWNLSLRGLFDTHIAAELLGLRSTGLGSLVEERMGVTMSKRHQRADWAMRPLTESMLEYAANDTRYLFKLTDELIEELRRAGREAWAREECRSLELASTSNHSVSYEPAARVKGAGRLSPRHLEALRAALDWRDRIARQRDVAPFRVIGDRKLLEAASTSPTSPLDLERVCGFPQRLARREGWKLLDRLSKLEWVPESEIEPLDRVPPRPSGRVPPDLEEAASRVKDLRNRRASELGIGRGKVLSNAMIATVIRRAPSTLEELARIEGVKKWQVELLGSDLIEAC